MVERTLRGATSADVVEERSRRRALTRAEDLKPGSQVQSRGGSDILTLPAETKRVLASEASVICAVTAGCGYDDKL